MVALSAPPGAGKSTALAQWAGLRRAAGDLVLSVHTPGQPTGDVWSSLVAAVRATAPSADGPAVATALGRVVNHPAVDASQTANAFRAVRRPSWIMIDDAHNWTQPAHLEQLARLVSSARPAMRLVLGARYTPHGLLSKVLLDGTAKEYRLADLAFDRDEARDLLLVENVVLPEQDLDLLLRRTDGWAAGLRLAAIALAREADKPSFVATFAGTDRTVGDYLVSEVLSRLPVGVVDLLLDISVADRVDLDLARILSGRPDAGALLDDLVMTNALVQPSQHDPACYELHPLLRSYLKAESRRRDERRYERDHAVAASWFERAAEPRYAIKHAALATDWRRVDELVARHSVRILLTDGPSAMRETLAALPARVQTRPAVVDAAALTAMLDGDLTTARLDLGVLDASGSADRAGRRLAVRALTELASAHGRAMRREEVDDAIASLDLVVGDDPDLALLGRVLSSEALTLTGDREAAVDTVHSVAQVARRRGLDFLLLHSLGALCLVAATAFDFAALRSYAVEAVQLAERRGWDRMPRMAQFFVNLAFLEWQQGDDTRATQYARSALEVADPAFDPVSACAARCLYDVIVVPDGRLDFTTVGHLHAFNDMWPLIPRPAVALTACAELMVGLRTQEMELAGAIIRLADEMLPDVPDVQVFKAMSHVYRGRDALARQELEPVIVDGRECMMPWSTAIAWAITAHLADASEQPANVHEALMHALRLGEPSRLVRGLIDAAPSVHRLLVRNRGRFGRYEAFVGELVEFAAGRPFDNMGTGLVLTDRELAVLRDLPSLMSLREIADAHVVSINTVKSHLKSVYRKLGVASRRQAVDHARELGLI